MIEYSCARLAAPCDPLMFSAGLCNCYCQHWPKLLVVVTWVILETSEIVTTDL